MEVIAGERRQRSDEIHLTKWVCECRRPTHFDFVHANRMRCTLGAIAKRNKLKEKEKKNCVKVRQIVELFMANRMVYILRRMASDIGFAYHMAMVRCSDTTSKVTSIVAMHREHATPKTYVFSFPPLLRHVLARLICIARWHFSRPIVGAKCKSNIGRRECVPSHWRENFNGFDAFPLWDRNYIVCEILFSSFCAYDFFMDLYVSGNFCSSFTSARTWMHWRDHPTAKSTALWAISVRRNK